MPYTLPVKPNPGLAEFFQAAENGETEQMLPYLKKYQSCCHVGEALTRAIRANRLETADVLLKNGVMAGRDAVFGALFNARANNSTEVFDILVRHGWDVNYGLGHSGDCLSLMANTQALFIVDWLLRHGADPNSGLVGDIHTALECAADKGNLPITKLLVQAGAQIETRSAVSDAAKNGHLDVVNYLLDAGAKIDDIPDNEEIFDNARDFGIQNPLCAAAHNGQVRVVQLLLNRGADPNIADTLGRTPLDLAWAKVHQDCVELLSLNQ